LAEIPHEADDAYDLWAIPLEFLNALERVVRGSIVDKNHLVPEICFVPIEDCGQPANILKESLAFAIYRNHNRNKR
jgi:hypothetical protein